MRKSNVKNSGLWSILCILLLGLAGRGQAQSERFPANVSPMLNAPYSLFLEDYTDPGKNQLVANVLFNDFNEPSWTFRLKLTIESTDVRLSTKNGFVPLDPITVQPGVVTPFSSTDWIEYFDFSNLDISGSGTELVRQNGRLPEGLYSFCIEVLDYETGDPLSRETCTNVWIQLNDPPRIISPICGNMVDPKLISFPIQWQLFNTQSPNTEMGTTYDLTIWQLTDPTADPFVAVPNGQALQVFQTTNLSSTTFIYGAAEPLLDIGETYVYQIKANALDGRDSFKNNGRSEFCHFNYGWPEGGEIELKWPEYDGGFKSEEQPYLSWGAPNNKRPNQPIAYQIEVMKMDEGQSPEEALALNEPWFTYQQPPTFNGFGGSINLPNLGKSEKYAWKITAFAGEQMIAESKVGLMNGPSLVEFFYAGNHRVNVDYINGKDVTNISGGGEVRVTPAVDEWTNLTFENISLIDNGGFWVLDRGSIEFDIREERIIELSPQLSDNGGASFDIQKYRLNPNGLYAFGQFLWDLPHATLSTEKPVVKSIEDWANFNNFTVNTVIELPENGNRFDLLEPYGFTLDLYQSSLVFINTDQFRFEFDGEVFVPQSVDRLLTKRASFTFENADQLYYIEGSRQSVNPIQIIPRTGMWLTSNAYTIDFNDNISPSLKSGDPRWRGVYFSQLDLTYDISFDIAGQFKLENRFTETYEDTENSNAFIQPAGLNLKIDSDNPLATSFTFQTFPSNLTSLELDVIDGHVQEESEFIGEFLLPIVSTQTKFSYTVPITSGGIKKGYLNDLVGTSFVHGEGDQQLELTITRAALSGNEKITMALDIVWETLGTDLKNIQGFNAWGDYNIGFGVKGGSIPLPERLNTMMGEYNITLDVVGAGNAKGYYAFATMMEFVMGDDTSGDNGAPQSNFYGVEENEYAPEGPESTFENIDEVPQTLEELEAQIEEEVEQQTLEFEQNLIRAASIEEDISVTPASLSVDQIGLFNGTTSPINEDALDTAPEDVSEDQNQAARDFMGFASEALIEMALGGSLAKIDSFEQSIQNKITVLATRAKDKINAGIDSIFIIVEDRLDISNNENLNTLLLDLVEGTKNSLKTEVESTFDKSLQDNIRDPIKILVIDEVKGNIKAYLSASASDIIYSAVISGNGSDPLQALKNVVTDGLSATLSQTFQEVKGFVKTDNIAEMLGGFASGLIKGININDIIKGIKDEALVAAGQFLIAEGVDALADAVIENLATDLPPLASTAINVGVAVAKMALSGNVKEALKSKLADKMPIVVRSPTLDVNGYVQFKEDHPTFGDVWVGDLEVRLKKPSELMVEALYINGRVDGYSYWMGQVKTGNDNTFYELGGVVDLTPRPLGGGIGIPVGPLLLSGISGRVFKKMKVEQDGTIIPDRNVRIGVGLGVGFIDVATNGTVLEMGLTVEYTAMSNGFVIEMKGNAYILIPIKEKPAQSAIARGTVQIRYNSAEKHFFGYGEMIMDATLVCAKSSVLVEIQRREWRLALGTREDPNRAELPCNGLVFSNWLEIGSNRAEVGVRRKLDMVARMPPIGDVNLGFVKFNLELSIYYELLGYFGIEYKPFFINKMGLSFVLEASLDVNYKWKLGFIRSKWKKLTLFKLLIAVGAEIQFIPKPAYMAGHAKAKIKILGIGVGVSEDFKINL
ncbi:MAG: hypothetical protein AAGI25_08660 [Bacteroidota bacterium]